MIEDSEQAIDLNSPNPCGWRRGGVSSDVPSITQESLAWRGVATECKPKVANMKSAPVE
jgi:hypothetical protein